ncbi:hypothetical protein [Escherichia phage PH1062]|nr:hypothetical protein [Escherichia phage PH1062]
MAILQLVINLLVRSYHLMMLHMISFRFSCFNLLVLPLLVRKVQKVTLALKVRKAIKVILVRKVQKVTRATLARRLN